MADAPRQNFFNLIRVQKDLEKIAGEALMRTPRLQDVVAEIAELERDAQDFILHWTEVITLSNHELAAHFLAQAPAAFRALDKAAVEDWVIKAMDAFDNRGLGFAIEVFDRLEPWIEAHTQNLTACALDQVAGVGGTWAARSSARRSSAAWSARSVSTWRWVAGSSARMMRGARRVCSAAAMASSIWPRSTSAVPRFT